MKTAKYAVKVPKYPDLSRKRRVSRTNTGHCYEPCSDPPDYRPDEVEFMKAMERFKRQSEREPGVRDVLAVAKSLGYRRSRCGS